ncbi:DUF1613-domain-containing protein [Irpex rosettiformis]|uniref:DUF1613-domain-containing protein n=1 Tax=Irpex rosettiformis TaxID=378272 RepID=A0ACB8UJS2_9APHY|nr:DUF1613-domain-containing protein [Irpex rosettiformis]
MAQLAQHQKPRYDPVTWDAANPDATVSLQTQEKNEVHAWCPLIHCRANFPIELFELAIRELVHHPEYNSTLILRSETISESGEDIPLAVPRLKGYKPLWTVHRKLLPRRPGRDAGLEQYCTMYASDSEEGGQDMPTVLVLTPILEPGSSLPYYHPAVSHLAFRYIQGDPPHLQIEAIPLPDIPTDVSSRLYRTSLALLETLHRYGYGAVINYKKRVIHDRLVPREIYQDVYLMMRERHGHLVNDWHESTDPLKHVFEDVGIATYLMLLWKEMYTSTSQTSKNRVPSSQSETNPPWQSWPRPPGGFVDLGCGNGLLTHILIAEGYEGQGIDVRARTSWAHYPEITQAHLTVEALNPTTLLHSPTRHRSLKPGAFLIGNHADELTPWVPVLSTICDSSGYLSIPCCAWTFDSRFERSKNSTFPVPIPLDEFTESLYLGGDGCNTSAYSQYRIWLASLSLHCGWKVESETLRIPSTRNWALIGRVHAWGSPEEEQNARDNVAEIIRNVQDRGIFKTRRPEGKAGDH